MTWEWSYSAEGIDIIYDRLQKQDSEWLQNCWAEWQCTSYKNEDGEDTHDPQFDDSLYEEKLSQASTLTDDVLIDAIWEYAQNLAECSKGGYEVYLCPYHCHNIFLR